VIVDSSALIAIVRKEADAELYLDALEQAGELKMSVANYLEASIVADGPRDPMVTRRFDDLIRIADIELRPVTVEQGRIAREAHRDFGRGSGHPAKLNFGDCFAYALAKETGEALLFKGNDFIHTDVERAADQ
jgi:ribonuclease VapC